VERLTKEIEEAAEAYIATIDGLGGSVAAIGYMQREIQDAAYRWQREVEERSRVVVGVNEFVTEDTAPANLFQIDPGVGEALRERIGRLRRSRDGDRARRALDGLEAAARGRDNLMAPLVEAVDASVTLGEICERLRGVFGVHQPSVTF
jgi:methylmalonyl-CoA mutase N-terminal domain/subunit